MREERGREGRDSIKSKKGSKTSIESKDYFEFEKKVLSAQNWVKVQSWYSLNFLRSFLS